MCGCVEKFWRIVREFAFKRDNALLGQFRHINVPFAYAIITKIDK